jgi:hypothetical protein
MLTVTKSLWATRQVIVDISASRTARSVLGNSVYSFGDIAFRCFRVRREVCSITLQWLSPTYGESRTIDDIPDVWERVTLGLPR